jgi:hypothetical protein
VSSSGQSAQHHTTGNTPWSALDQRELPSIRAARFFDGRSGRISIIDTADDEGD